MKLHSKNADFFVPDGTELQTALKRTTHLGIGAHQDDIELMSTHGILECFESKDKWFAGITCTDGGGSPRAGIYSNYTDDEMKVVRLKEQKVAASIGQYGAIVQLGYPSKTIKDPKDKRLRDDLAELIKTMRPKVVYTHNPLDKHNTHVGVVLAALGAMRTLPPADRPEKVYGCEVWRTLDWVPDPSKVVLDVGGRDHLVAALTGVYDSQIAGGKRYDLATLGRFRANATYLDSHSVDKCEAAMYALDLTPIIRDDKIAVTDYVRGLMDDFRRAVEKQFVELIGPRE